MRRTLGWIALALTFPAAPGGAQQAPSTDIWIADLVARGESVRAVNPRNLTARTGYDNQPWFLPDGTALLYTSQRDGQTDIFELDLSSGATRQVTRTGESEFSPQVTPDESGISVVRVEADGTQRIWTFPLSGAPPRLVAPAARGIGYYAWLDEATLVAFVLGEPFTLQRIDLVTGEQQLVASGIGRSLHRIPGRREASYTAPDGDATSIFAYDPTSGASRRIAPAPPSESHDYAWMPDGALIASSGSRLFYLRPGRDSAWSEIAELGGVGIHGISRLAISPDGRRLALVAAE